MKKMLASLLAVCILLTNIPIKATAKTTSPSNTYIEITKDSTKLRNGPGEKYETLLTAEVGDCLIYTGSTKNKHGNVFLTCHLNGSEQVLYVYEKNVKFHDHIFNCISDEISVCKCGEYVLNTESPIVHASVAVATGSLLSAEAVAVASSLSAAAVSAAAALSTALPLVAVVAVGGLLIYMGVSSSAAQVNDVVCFSNELDVYEHLESEFDSKSPYHKACLVPSSSTLIISKKGMDLDNANKYLKSLATSLSYATLNTITEQSMFNVWCWTEKQADDLGRRFSKNGYSYGYGSSSDADCSYEIDKDQHPNKIYFKHFHLWYQPYSARFLKKVNDVHIFYDLPSFANNA